MKARLRWGRAVITEVTFLCVLGAIWLVWGVTWRVLAGITLAWLAFGLFVALTAAVERERQR